MLKKQKIIQQGAEAVIIKNNSKIIKKRIKKSYRHKDLDEKIRKLRTRSEGKLLKKASKVTSIPKMKKIDEKNKEIIMDFIKGKKLSENLNKFSLKKQEKICLEIGKEISNIHNINLIHGDLTTSNMILVENNDKKSNKKPLEIYFLDFGLGYHSRKDEDKAVDLHLLRQALEAKHSKTWKKLFSKVIQGYKKKDKKLSEKIINRIKKVESRGRYKNRF